MIRKLVLTALVGLLALAVLPAGAQDASVTATATRDGTRATVSGSATFVANDGAFDVGGARTGFANDDVADQLGINIQSASVEVTDDGVEFTWHVNSLPDEVPPEGVRYTWAFRAGNQSYQLQAKRTNVASITTAEDPVGHANQLASGGDWFQLRGACQDAYAHPNSPVSGCYHLAFLDGSFNSGDNTITMFMPFHTRDSIGRLVGETFVPGAEIIAEETAGSSITATVQAMVSNPTTESFINSWDSFFAGETVQGFIGEADQSQPGFGQEWTTLDLDEDGTFSGTLDGASSRNDTVHVRACNLTTCATTALPV